MLKQRVLTAIPLATLVIWGILTQSSDVIFYSLLFVLAIGAWEWAQLSGIQNKRLRILYAAIIVISIYAAYYLLQGEAEYRLIVYIIATGFWGIATYHMFIKGPAQPDSNFSSLKCIIGFIVLVPPVLALMDIRHVSSQWLFYCLSIVWVADIGAYFSGKRFGKIKLAPALSPGKTREGLYGALFATSLYSLAAGYYFELTIMQIVMLLGITILATIISVMGDLFISLLKREKALKDTGHILPGHGGVLDRVDSVTSATPLLALLLSLVIF